MRYYYNFVIEEIQPLLQNIVFLISKNDQTWPCVGIQSRELAGFFLTHNLESLPKNEQRSVLTAIPLHSVFLVSPLQPVSWGICWDYLPAQDTAC